MKSIVALLICLFTLQAGAQKTTIAKPNQANDTLALYKRDYTALQREAIITDKPFILLFGADTSEAFCKLMKETLSDPTFAHFINNNYLILYADAETINGAALTAKFRITEMPVMKFFDPRGDETESVYGFFTTQDFYRKHLMPVVETGREGGGYRH